MRLALIAAVTVAVALPAAATTSRDRYQFTQVPPRSLW